MSEAVAPDYLPARMLNEFVFCPRLFYYEWVDGLFAESRDTVAGSLRHEKLEKEDALPSPEAVADGRLIHSRSVTLSSDTHRLIAKLDLIEGEDGLVTPVDYKIGSPRRNDEDGEITVWDADRVQLGAQALVLLDSGYLCKEGVIYYVATKQRVRVPVNDALIQFTLEALRLARVTAAGSLPPPLIDSPKCPRCSLVGICLPDETRLCGEIAGPDQRSTPSTTGEIRRLVPARDDLRPVYLNSQGFRVGKSGEVLQVHDAGKKVQEIRFNEISQVNLFGNIQVTTQAIQSLTTAEIPIAYFSQAGWFYAITHGLGMKNIELRRRQFHEAERPEFCLGLARALVIGKIKNQRTLLLRNHVEPPRQPIALLKELQSDAERAPSLEVLLGVEGYAARAYFEHFVGMIKVGDRSEDARDETPDEPAPLESPPSVADELMALFSGSDSLTDDPPVLESSPPAAPKTGSSPFTFDFNNRNRRPPLDPINALLSLAYSVLAKDLTIVCHAVGFDPYLGFYHQPRFGRSSLALDLMEPFRPLIADSVVLNAINTRMVTLKDFIQAGPAVALTPAGRKAFFRAYEQRMDTLVTHPLFGYRVSYRRILEIQARLLARLLQGELETYPVFTTR